ncbi:MAG: guanylate kinase [Mariprofundaceae bacterium]
MADSAKKGAIFVISGPSGSGKTSLCTALLAHCPNLRLSVSATTRAPRLGEVNAADYHFLSRAEFERSVAADDFLEHAQVHGQHYGTRKTDVEMLRRQMFDVLLEIDWQGAAQVAAYDSEVCRIFILPPSIEELRRRLTGRGQDDADIIERRVSAAESEMAHADEADYRITNETFALALEKVMAIVRAHSAV